LEEPKDPPIVFANRVIRQFADHLLGNDLIIEPKDFMVIRVVFRKLGGNWVDLIQGNIKQLEVLERVLTNWGKVPGRKRKSPDA
jgi:hypothetical protein